MDIFDAVKSLIDQEIAKGNKKFIIFPYGRVGEMAKIILDAYHNSTYILVDNKKTGANIHKFDAVTSDEYKEYKILFCCIAEVYLDLKDQLEKEGISKERILELNLQCFSYKYNEKKIWEHVDYFGILDPRRGMIERCSREIYYRNISGNCAEAGVYQGEFAKHINFWFPDRTLYLADTFEGFPQKDITVENEKGFSDGKQDWSNTNVNAVLSKMPFAERCVVKKGRFPDSMRDVDDTFAYVSLDMDLYQSTLEGLKYFYPRLSVGGYIMVHDCCNEMYLGARKAVEEYCAEHHVGYVICADGCGTAVITK